MRRGGTALFGFVMLDYLVATAMGPWNRLVQSLSTKLAFFPPKPSTYQVKEHRDGTGDSYIQPIYE